MLSSGFTGDLSPSSGDTSTITSSRTGNQKTLRRARSAMRVDSHNAHASHVSCIQRDTTQYPCRYCSVVLVLVCETSLYRLPSALP